MEKEIAEVVGPENVTSDPRILEKYSKDQSFARPCMPSYVVWPKDVKEVQEVVKIANKHLIPIVSYSSGMNLRGATIPDQRGSFLTYHE